MIDVLYYSISGKRKNESIDLVLLELKDAPYIPAQDRKILAHTLAVADKGSYPEASYYALFYAYPQFHYESLSEILLYVDTIKDYFKKSFLQRRVIECFNDTTTYKNLVQSISEVVENTETSSELELDNYKFVPYSKVDVDLTEGYKTNISELDTVTYGFQPGTVGSICAFTSQGKSTTWISIAYNNAKAGKKVALFSLEVHPSIVWCMFQARYYSEEKGMDITAQDLIMKKLTDEKREEMSKYEDDFQKDIVANLIIVDESLVTKAIIINYKLLSKVFKELEKFLGGLDITIWDHVGQLELMFPDLGNTAIRTITAATKTYLNQNNLPLFTGLAVQANREGYRRAQKRGGVYDLLAISDLNEVERSSTYVIFLYTPEDLMIIQETKLTMVKHRLGRLITEPTTVTFNPALCVVGSSIETITASDFTDFTSFETAFDTPTFEGFD